jgi:hypothetical protein
MEGADVMRTDGRRERRRPRGAVLGPLGLLLAAVATGFGMWHVLTREPVVPSVERLSRHHVPSFGSPQAR